MKYMIILALLLTGCSSGSSSKSEYITAIIGDSNCISTDTIESYPDQLGWLNLCIGKQRANQVSHIPDVQRVVFAIGLNDATFGAIAGDSSREGAIAAYESLLTTAYNQGSELACILPVKTLIKPFQINIERLRDELIPLCQNYGAEVIYPIETYQDDGIHINQSAHNEMAIALYP